MSKDLILVKQEAFGNVNCEFYRQGKEIFMTRQQIGEALGYAEPKDAIYRIHERYKDRLDKLSVVDKLSTTDGKKYETVLYTAKGVYEICRRSNQEKANDFYDFVYEILEGLRKGEMKVVEASEYEKTKLAMHIRNADARLLKEKRAGLDFVMKTFGHVLSKESLQALAAVSTQMITGTAILPKPEMTSRTYSATEIGERLGMSANAIGKLTNEHNLKTDEYGKWVLSKSRYSEKQVNTFEYYDKILDRIKEITAQK